jgi:hypothetical protein
MNSKITVLKKVELWSSENVPNKFIQWAHKKFFFIEWKDVSCIKCNNKLVCVMDIKKEMECKKK